MDAHMNHRQINEDQYGLVLSGGGTKGAYEIGAWKALAELEIPIQGIVGASIGAINGALMMEGNIDKAEELYRSVQLKDILETVKSIDPTQDVFSLSNAPGILKDVITQGGLSNDGLKNMIQNGIDLDKIYESEVDFGIITYSVDSLSHHEVFKEDIPREQMADFITASANFPIFKPTVAGGTRYVDGGVYDTVPVNMLIDRGYKKIIVIDINGFGRRRKIENKDGVYVKMVQCSEDLGGTFEFSPEKINRNIQLGYLDTLKTFQKLQGFDYYFTSDYFNKLIENFSLNQIFGLEKAARLYGINRYQIYENDRFLEEIYAEHLEARKNYKEARSDGILTQVIRRPSMILKMINNGSLIVWIEEIFGSSPWLDFKGWQIFLGNYIFSGAAMIELENYLSH